MPKKMQQPQKQRGQTPGPSGDQLGENAGEGRFAKQQGSKKEHK